MRASRRPTGVALPLVLVGALLVAALGVGAAWWLTRPTPAQADPVVTGQASSPFLPPAGSTTPTRPTSTTRPTTTAPPNPGTLLQQQVAADRSAVEAMVGYWVPQISSKTVGTVDNGITYGVPEIWAELQTNKSRYAGTAVLRSEDYSSFDLSGYWVTIVATPYATPAQADAWCTAHNLGPNDCFGKKLTHTGGSAGTTSHR